MHPDEMAEATDWILKQSDPFASDIDPKLLRPLRYARRVAAPEVAHASIFARERRAAIRRAVARLTPRERFVLRLRHRDGDPVTYRVIGLRLGVTTTGARDIHLRALFHLRFLKAGLHAYAERPQAQVKTAWLVRLRCASGSRPWSGPEAR